ncbi:poly(A) polymerase [Chelatococcus reniformis]|uniref:Poly(A) polymerase n=1 Tax=Chelatococcus reniformis TaxID=1494448 RepID=A0A916UNJ8_9HYPH|nr:poly(A) polymerase [Chelatococcus reniformis]
MRNALVGAEVHEVDVATTAVPAETVRRARRAKLKAVPTGIEHGTVTVVVAGTPFEVTTLRHDVVTDGRHAKVRFGRDFAEDAARRDFTINALSLSRDGTVHDTTGGLADLAARRVRFIGDPTTRIREDYLRTLRFFRFHAQYATGPIDVAGLHAAIRERAGLARLSRERLRAELLKLVAAPGAAATVAELSHAGLLLAVTGAVAEPGRLTALAGRSDTHAHDPMLRLAALLVRVREDADNLRERLRLTNAEYARLLDLAALQSRLRSTDGPLDRRAIRRLAVDHGAQPVADAAALLAGCARPALTAGGTAALAALAAGTEAVPSFPLGGADVINAGVPPGAGVGRVLARARGLWLDADCPLDAETIADLLTQSLPARDSH